MARLLAISFLVALFSTSGCSKSPFDLAPVTGTVKYVDGTVPAAESRLIRFEPVATAGGPASHRPATAQVKPDGTFEAMTLKPGDGAMPGEYKVVLLFWKSHIKQDSVLPKEYGKAASTPLPVISVKAGQKNHFDLVIEKRLPRS